MTRLRKSLVPIGTAAAAAALLMPAAAYGDILTPESPHSPNTSEIETAYVIVRVIVTIVAVAVVALLITALGRFRAGADAPRRARRGGRGVQLSVSAGLAALAAAILVIGIAYTEGGIEPEPTGTEGFAQTDPLEIQVSGQQWLWRYEYPQGLSGEEGRPPVFSYHELVVPVETSVRLNVITTDTFHRWWVPALAPMVTAVPGKTNETWFKADEEGIYAGRSTEYSGAGTAAMKARVRVVSPGEFQQFVDEQADEIEAAQNAVEERVAKGQIPGIAQ